jgi:demethylmenaquinone methyltransferase / 2-methoxy-6-polyprenyl-1,4-benzoquinol methylase
MTAEKRADFDAISADEREAQHSAAVRAMFSGIARRYDLLNHLLSLNIDKTWRRKVRGTIADVLRRPDARVLDVACGTGDLTLALADGAKAKVVGTDFCAPMLELAKQKSKAKSVVIPFVEADAMKLPLDDRSFDAATIGFGLRNLPNIENGLRELHRILKSGGTLVVLEFSSPFIPGFRQLFNLYFRRILPLIGGMISGSRAAYTYLPGSVAKFLDQRELAELMVERGFVEVRYTNLTGGIVAIHVGRKR